MSNPDPHPTETVCENDSSQPELLAPREVPLGGPRAMTVRRTLPQRALSLIGAWCFVDHFGPDDVSATDGMRVARHPHTGLATVSWLFEGEIEHRDSGGVVALVRPGEVNLMTAGHGIAHSEVSTSATQVLHGVQLWVALPAHAREGDRDFQHHRTFGRPRPFRRHQHPRQHHPGLHPHRRAARHHQPRQPHPGHPRRQRRGRNTLLHAE